MESDLNKRMRHEGMNNEDLEQMRLLSDEIRRDIVYKDHNGFYNFEMLEGLLKKHDFITSKDKERFDELRTQQGILQPYHAKELTRVAQDILQVDPERNTNGWAGMIASWFKRPEYDHIAHWYQWTRLLKCKQPTTLFLADNWTIKYIDLFEAIQVSKDLDEDNFVSILGPKLSYYKSDPSDPADPFFEIYARKENEKSQCTRGITSYAEVMQIARRDFGVEIPTESEIDRVILLLNAPRKTSN